VVCRFDARRRDASAEIKRKVALLTSASQTQEEKMHALANFIQSDIRYVGIWLGIGDATTFSNRRIQHSLEIARTKLPIELDAS